MGKPRIPPPVIAKYDKMRADGYSRPAATAACNVSLTWGQARDRKLRSASGDDVKYQAQVDKWGVPKTRAQMSPEARRALDDFAYFRRRYFGRVSSPWQEEAGNTIVELLATPQKEFVVINCPPGSGKSTLFTHDIPVWLTARNRAIRGLIGSRTEKQARTYTGRMKRTLERNTLALADDDLKRKGRAYDAEGVLAADYGSFRPSNPDVWRREEFIVEQADATSIDEKEPTWTAFGMDSGSLGWRVDYVLWDDVVDKTVIRTVEAMENQRTWWEDEAETRLEPDGLLVLQGQRMSSTDLYRHSLDMKAGADDEDEISEQPKYRHIIYKAHYEDICEGVHSPRDAQPYPNGCLLDPIRLPWRELSSIQRNRGAKYRVLYQQEDLDPATVLVQKAWIDGGRDAEGADCPGCWDNDRDVWQIPAGLSQPYMMIATADPSPTKFWSIQAWLYHPASEQRFLIDLIRQSMDAPDFLDWNANSNTFTGVMEEWQKKSEDLGIPFSYWIVESNAAQRFLLQYDHVRRWVAKHGCQIIPHQTHRNKSDPEFGVQTIAPHYRFGRVRLPGMQRTMARPTSLKLVDEVTRWPEGQTDDCVMAHWFLEWNLPQIYVAAKTIRREWRPTWLTGARA